MKENSSLHGWSQKTFQQPVKRYCLTLDLKDDAALIEEYVKIHSEPYHWREIREGLKSVGVLEMEIYRAGIKLFMVVETPLDFDWEDAFKRLADFPRQAEWEQYMSTFQNAVSGASSAEKWQSIDRIFFLYDLSSPEIAIHKKVSYARRSNKSVCKAYSKRLQSFT